MGGVNKLKNLFEIGEVKKAVYAGSADMPHLETSTVQALDELVDVDYKIEGADGILYTKARTVQVPVDAATHDLVLGSPQVLIDNVARRLEEAGLASE